ncbi:MAG: peptidylprolyl isomerase [Longimicrobiales bacterium]
MKTNGCWVLVAAALATTACSGGDAGDEEPFVDMPLYHPETLAEESPATFDAVFETSKGQFVIAVDRSWAPNAADRFYTAVKNEYYDDVRFYRVVEGFMAQFGLHGNPRVTAVWTNSRIMDDPVVESNLRGIVTFAMTGQPNSRTTQLFINLVDNAHLDESGFAPFGRVVEGMDVVDQLYAGYGDGPPSGNGPYQPQIRALGNEYLEEEFPELDYVVRATVREVAAPESEAEPETEPS